MLLRDLENTDHPTRMKASEDESSGDGGRGEEQGDWSKGYTVVPPVLRRGREMGQDFTKHSHLVTGFPEFIKKTAEADKCLWRVRGTTL